MENLLDHLRRSARRRRQTRAALFRATDALEKAVGLAVPDGNGNSMSRRSSQTSIVRARRANSRTCRPDLPASAAAAASVGSGRLVHRDSSEAPIKGAARRSSCASADPGTVTSATVGERVRVEDFDGRFAFELDTPAAAREIEARSGPWGMWSA